MATINTTTTVSAATRAEELRDLLAFAEQFQYGGSTEKLEKVLAQWTAPRERKAGPSKTAVANAALAEQVLAVMPDGEPVTSKWVTEHVHGVTTTQKATVIMGILVNRGLVAKAKTSKGMTYTAL